MRSFLLSLLYPLLLFFFFFSYSVLFFHPWFFLCSLSTTVSSSPRGVSLYHPTCPSTCLYFPSLMNKGWWYKVFCAYMCTGSCLLSALTYSSTDNITSSSTPPPLLPPPPSFFFCLFLTSSSTFSSSSTCSSFSSLGPQLELRGSPYCSNIISTYFHTVLQSSRINSNLNYAFVTCYYTLIELISFFCKNFSWKVSISNLISIYAQFAVVN